MVRKSSPAKTRKSGGVSVSPPKGLNTNIRQIDNGFIISTEQQQTRNGPYKPPKERFVKTLPKGLK